MLVDGILVCLAQDRYWYVQADGDFVGWLKAHALGRDVQINDPESFVVQIQGPKSMDVLAAACNDGLPDLDREEPLINGPVTRDGRAIGHITGGPVFTAPEGGDRLRLP